MKKLFLILVLGFVYSNALFAEQTAFICKNKNGKEREFALLVDLKKKLLVRAGTEYPIVEITDDYVIGLIESYGYEIYLYFNRYTGLLTSYSFLDGVKKSLDSAEYDFMKGKKLI